jgi:signal transduction histidine kinase
MSNPACVNRVLTVRTLVEQDNCVVIKVEDTGPGIGRAQSEDIFKPFFTTKPNGMGLGLSICRTIVESHGGHLTAISDAKHGSIFRIDLPKYGGNAHGK